MDGKLVEIYDEIWNEINEYCKAHKVDYPNVKYFVNKILREAVLHKRVDLKGKIEFVSVEVKEDSSSFLLRPGIEIIFEIDNRTDYEIILDRLLYNVISHIGSWGPCLGRGIFLERTKIPSMEKKRIESFFSLQQDVIDRITERMGGREDIYWHFKISGYFYGGAGEFKELGRLKVRTPRSDWEKWVNSFKRT